MDLSGGIMGPTHRNFDGAQAVPFGEKQYFRIEPESLDALLFEDYLRAFTNKRFEPTLRILKRQAGEEPDEAVENHSCNLTPA